MARYAVTEIDPDGKSRDLGEFVSIEAARAVIQPLAERERGDWSWDVHILGRAEDGPIESWGPEMED